MGTWNLCATAFGWVLFAGVHNCSPYTHRWGGPGLPVPLPWEQSAGTGKFNKPSPRQRCSLFVSGKGHNSEHLEPGAGELLLLWTAGTAPMHKAGRPGWGSAGLPGRGRWQRASTGLGSCAHAPGRCCEDADGVGLGVLFCLPVGQETLLHW